ncbi:MAG: DUF1109 domain-containing protein [Betaproteobacteria bacterium]|nr:MAG: DUF1109 domain-containing protein [Betaproteobacteria bacterium]
MKTDELVSMLAREAGGAVARSQAWRRLVVALATGTLASGLLMAAVLGLRPDLAQAAQLSMFWVKMGFPLLLSGATLHAFWRLAHPGMRLQAAPAGIAAPVLAMAALAIVTLLAAAPGERTDLIFGTTWKSCPFNIAFLATPVFVSAIWLMRGLAPTRQRLAGAVCGLLAGAIAALVYALHCPELAAPFIAVWYVLGMLIPAIAGAVLGPRLLSW